MRRRIAAINKQLAAARAPTERLGKEFDKLASNVGLRDVSKYAKDLQDRFGKIASSLGSMGPLTGAFAGGIGVAGAFTAARSVADLGTNLRLSAQQAGVHTDQLQRLGFATRLAGGSADAAATSYATLNANMQRGRQGLADPAFYAAMSQMDPEWRTQGAAQAMDHVLHSLAKMPSVTAKNIYGVAALSGSFDGMKPLVVNGTKALDTYQQTAQRMPAITDAQAQQLDQLRGSMTSIGISLETVAQQTMIDLVPAMGKATGATAAWLLANQNWLATDISGRVKTVTKDLNAAAAAIGGWKAASSDLLEFYIGSFFPGIIGGAIRADAVLRALGKYAQQNGWTDQKNWATGQDEGPQNIGSFSGSWKSFKADVLDAPQSFGVDALTNAIFATRPISSAQAKAVRDQGMAFWMQKGFTKAQAAGMMGNAEQESGFNPGANNGSHFGLFQWDKTRALAIKSATGIDVSSAPAADQFQAAWYELNRGKSATLAALRASKNPWAASDAFNTGFEVSGDSGLQRGLYSEAINSDATPMILTPGGRAGAPGASGKVEIHIRVSGAPPGTRVSAKASGAGIKGPPRIVMPMPALEHG